MSGLSNHVSPVSASPLMRPERQISARAIAATLLALGCFISLALNWPGQLSYDSVVQLHDGRTAHYNPWHPPVMAWLLGIEDWLVPGTALFILLDAIVFFASVASLLWLSRRSSRFAIAVSIVCIALPQCLLYQGIVWKDVLFSDAALAGFVLLAHAAARWKRAGLRWSLIAASFGFLVLATLVRQNGAIALLSGGLALILVARANGFASWNAAASGIAAVVAAGIVVYAASAAFLARTGGRSGTPGQIRLLELYDLTGIVKLDHTVRLDALAHTNPDLERLIRSNGSRLYTPVRNNTLGTSAALQHAFNMTSPAAIAAQWRLVVRDHPLDYLRVRAQVFGWTFFTPDPVQCEDWYTGVTGPPADLRMLGLTTRYRTQDRWLAGYAALFAFTPVLSHAAFAGIAAVIMAFLLWRRRPADLAVAGLIGAALAFTASFFVISIACDYRYLLFLDLAAVASLLYCAADGARGLAKWKRS